MRQLRETGLSNQQIAEAIGISRRSVIRLSHGSATAGLLVQIEVRR